MWGSEYIFIFASLAMFTSTRWYESLFVAGFDTQPDMSPEAILSFAGDSLMEVCDSNSNREISKKELKICYVDLQTKKFAPDSLSPKDFLQVYDVNKDGKLTKREFVEVLARHMHEEFKARLPFDDDMPQARTTNGKPPVNAADPFGSQKVKVTTRDGKTKFVTQTEMMEMMKNQNSHLQDSPFFGNEFGEVTADEEGRYVKEASGTKKLEEIAKSDPQLSRFIALSKWVVNVVNETGHLNLLNASENIIQLKTLPHGGSPNRGQEKLEDQITLGADFDVSSA
jgi:hypothetical protein